MLGSVIYTYRVDRRVKESLSKAATPTPVSQQVVPVTQEIPQAIQTPVATPVASYAQIMKRAQVKESISGIGEDLDELIDELRDKEAEVREILHRVKGWKADLVTENGSGDESPITGMVGLSMPAPNLPVEPPVVRSADEPSEMAQRDRETMEFESTEVSSTANDADAKYRQMILLLDQGISPDEIARTLNMGQREVELVQKMRQKGV